LNRLGFAGRAAELVTSHMTSTFGTIESSCISFGTFFFITESVYIRLPIDDLDFDSTRAAETVSVLALQDWLNQSTTNKDAVTKSITIYGIERPMYPNTVGTGVRFRYIVLWACRSLIVSLFSHGPRI
jgi:hypothetical protein